MSSGGEGVVADETLTLGAVGIFDLTTRIEVPNPEDGVHLYAKHSQGEVNFIALVVRSHGGLVLGSDHEWSSGSAEKGWLIKHIPWFDDPASSISAVTFDEEGCLFVGTSDGSIFELNARDILIRVEDGTEDLQELCHLNMKIHSMQVYNQDSNKIVLNSCENGKLVIWTNHAPPVLVTFTSAISSVELFINKTGLTCALVCLDSGQNVFTVLDDLDLPAIQNESLGKRSIFKKAKDNLMSRLSDDKGFFGKKSHKDKDSPTSPASNISQNVVSSATVAQTSMESGSVSQKPVAVPSNNVKFQSIDEVSCRGILKKVQRQSQFVRHSGNKLDVFDGDFRQVATIFVSTSVTKLFVIQKIYFAVDEDNRLLRASIINNAVLKEFAVIPFDSKVLSIEPCGEDGTPYNLLVIAETGVYELSLRKTPLETCVDLLLKETGTNLLDSVCNALNVPKTLVCVKAGDAKSEEGKFSKTIIFYKLAGLTYTQICAKFGSRSQIPAMLFFFELVDQERTKLAGGTLDRQAMADLALLGRVEQYLRYGLVRSELPRSPETLLRKMLSSNIYYSSRKAAQYLATSYLTWGLKIIAQSRLCYPEILASLQDNFSETGTPPVHKKLFWNLLTSDWLAIYTAKSTVFFWFRSVVMKALKEMNTPTLNKLVLVMLPWRRELQRKILTEISDLSTVIDFTTSPECGRVVVDDYITLFIIILLEVVRRNNPIHLSLPTYVYKSDAHMFQKKEISNHKNNMIATMMLSYTFVKSFSASGSHCLCVRNGKVYSWGENKTGRLGIGDERNKPIVDTPTPINLSPSLKISIDSVCAGHNHSLALTNFGTILVWGSNKFGQLGLGSRTSWTGRPVPLDLPGVIFTCIAAGSYHSVAIDHLNRVWTWGWGIYGQLGYGGVENRYKPGLIDLKEKIVFVSAGHSHTVMLNCFGVIFTCGCNHFGQLGLGINDSKWKLPSAINSLPKATIIRLVECGVCSTVMVTTKNRLFYTGLNPATLKSLLSGAKRRENRLNHVEVEEEKDFFEPTLIDTTHMAGDISKVSASSTHFAVMTSLGYVYTWGIGKSGQLVRPDDDSKTLELIDCDDKMMIASDVGCAGDCTFVMERDTGHLFGCGFNSCGQLGKMESDDESSVMTIRTKKRIVKVRQPSNIYFRLRQITGLPRQMNWDGESSSSSLLNSQKISPPTKVVNQELLEWCLTVFRRNYDSTFLTDQCLEWGNFPAASLLETLAENHELALKHNLAAGAGNQIQTEEAIGGYLSTSNSKAPSIEQACRFLAILINHWDKCNFQSSDLEDLLEKQRSSIWGAPINCAIKEIISTADESGEWIAANLTPLFILQAIKSSDSSKLGLERDNNKGSVISPSEQLSSIDSDTSPIDILNSPNGEPKLNGFKG